MKTLYEATSTAIGGRGGHVNTEDNKIDLELSVPESMGGDSGSGVNPEQLFGCAYAACFGGAMEVIAKKKHVDIQLDSVKTKMELFLKRL
jgi:osmotically inducible protein OsmC